jgi:hypothetical protein
MTKKDELTRAQECAYNDIQNLCGELGQNHWFQRKEVKWNTDPTLNVLINKGYLISKFCQCNEGTYYQYTGKVYEKPVRCWLCHHLVNDEELELEKNKEASDGYKTCMKCYEKLYGE